MRGLKYKARPGAWTAGGWAQGRAEVAGNNHRLEDSSTVFYNGKGQLVGQLVAGYLVKHVDSRLHQLRKPPAWCIDRDHLDHLVKSGALGVRLIDETAQEWTASVDRFLQYGQAIDRGHGEQIALPLAKWSIKSALQPRLFGLDNVA